MGRNQTSARKPQRRTTLKQTIQNEKHDNLQSIVTELPHKVKQKRQTEQHKEKKTEDRKNEGE